jgi:CheY-like chemotaxis protein
MKILLIEDEPFMVEAMSSILENAGHSVVKTDSAAEAKKLLGSESFSLILTDLYLPAPDGFELVNHSKENPKTKDIPVIVVSGMVDHPETLSSKVHADAWLTKPFTIDELKDTIKRIMEIEI